MHSLTAMGLSNVPAFLTKLWQLVEDPSTDELIAWDAGGTSFHLFDQARFAKEVLPLYFKHNNIASFIRQLNMYGFRKVVHIGQGSIKCEVDDVEFHHPYFVRGEEHLLENIKRKTSLTGTQPAVSGVKTEAGLTLNQEDVTRVLNDVQHMKGKQENIAAKMDKMKKENEALWREVANLRQKHMKQQQIVNKLIQFMIHLVGGNSNTPLQNLTKRKMPLMLNDANQVMAAKRPRYGNQISIEELTDVINTPGSSRYKEGVDSSPNASNGPVIQELIDSPLDSDSVLSSSVHNNSKSTDIGELSGATGSSLDTMAIANRQDGFDSSLDSTDLSNLLNSVGPSGGGISFLGDSGSQSGFMDRYIKDHPLTDRSLMAVHSPKELSTDIDHIQDDIDSLKDMLSGGQYHFDANTLLSFDDMPSTRWLEQIFGNENQVPVTIENLLGDARNSDLGNMLPNATESNPNNITGHELVQFQPIENFLLPAGDLSDLIDPEDMLTPGPNGLDDLTRLVTKETEVDTTTGVSDTEYDVIDPMSFINTDPVQGFTDE
ncbi:heat shock factor protein-like isoform X2 [Dreissena polymorpha]|uniref:heat shock factor protein-like isoform X2 n=1 Tax=Dreissena polymorpha TaxID=45954 RepID=UPI0022656A8F|nr:heat shock factor protein-like isoform X2 [Dreissena polymorpha]